MSRSSILRLPSMAGKSAPMPVATLVRYVDCSAGRFSYPTAIGMSTCWKQCADPSPTPLTASTLFLCVYLAWCPAALAAASMSLTVFTPATLWIAPMSNKMVCLLSTLQFSRFLMCTVSFSGDASVSVSSAAVSDVGCAGLSRLLLHSSWVSVVQEFAHSSNCLWVSMRAVVYTASAMVVADVTAI